MAQLPPKFHHSFTEEFLSLLNLYKEVKGIVLLAEYENKEQKYIISSVNELRNMLDHIMRIIDSPETLKKNFDKAKGHLYRAGYDAYEIIAISKLNEIEAIKEQYKFEAITTAYPDYFNKAIPATKKAKNQLVSARANKMIDNGIDEVSEEKHFFQFENIVTELIQTVDDLKLHIDGISEVHRNIIKQEEKKREEELIFYQKEQRNNRNNYLKIGIIAPVIVSLIIGLILLSIEYNWFIPREKTITPETKTEQVIP